MCKSVECDNTIATAVRGDRRAMERLLLEHYDRLEMRIAAQLPQSLQSLVQVEDILQETFVQAIQSMSQCQATSAESFTAWLDTIANNRVLDTIRLFTSLKRGGGRKRVRRNSRLDSSLADAVNLLYDSGSTPGRKAECREVITRMNSAIDNLPTDQRDAIRLRYLQGVSVNETARMVDRSPNAIRGLLHRAKRRLREIMESSSRWFDKK